MGFGPREVDRMSLWEFMSLIEAQNTGRDGEKDKPDPMSTERLQALGVEGF